MSLLYNSLENAILLQRNVRPPRLLEVNILLIPTLIPESSISSIIISQMFFLCNAFHLHIAFDAVEAINCRLIL